MSTPHETVTLRPAQADDCAALADLLVQLYHAEMPGVLRGTPEGQRAFVSALLSVGGLGGWTGRSMVYDSDGALVGTAGMYLPGEPQIISVPPGIFLLAWRSLGPANALVMITSMARAVFSGGSGLPPSTAYIHSVVVDQRARGRGVGQALLAELERSAAERGARAVQLRVIVGNEPARRLYLRQGYRVVGRTPRWIAPLTFPTETMHKTLAPE
ncbi:MAG TPA: GNAT family N-acetyltransferase [Roseiflexaceae bacterium]|nr:GNAT family N-acetyltransferase [Roseiflexaceae bacterium]